MGTQRPLASPPALGLRSPRVHPTEEASAEVCVGSPPPHTQTHKPYVLLFGCVHIYTRVPDVGINNERR